MKAFLGPYGMNREGSGTSWLPDTTPHEGVHGKFGEWTTMWHALINGVYDQQGGPRGGQKIFANGMVMAMAQRAMGDGTVGVRAMPTPCGVPVKITGDAPNALATATTTSKETFGDAASFSPAFSIVLNQLRDTPARSAACRCEIPATSRR